MSKDSKLPLSRRKLLGSAAVIGGAGALGGAATTSLLWDEEKFGNADDPNVLQAGELDLKVDWEGTYYNWMGNPTFSSAGQGSEENPNEVDQPQPLFPAEEGQQGVQVVLDDLKPGDVIEVTLSAHVYGNPAFLGGHTMPHEPRGDNGINEPEDKVNGHTPDQSDGTPGGDLQNYVEVVIWHDDGDNLHDEVRPNLDSDDDGELDIDEEQYVMDIASIQDASAAFDDTQPGVLYAGDLASVPSNILLDARNAVAGNVAEDFPETACYQNSVTEYMGWLMWLPRDLPGVNDNIIQTDQFSFQFGFDAIQCRHNVGNDGMPMDGTIGEADAENNANSPGA